MGYLDRMWAETISGLAYWPDANTASFDDALNAFIGAAIKASPNSHMPVVQNYSAFVGLEGVILHTALVVYYGPTRLDYGRVIDDLLEDHADSEASVGFIPEDDWTQLRAALPQESIEDDATDIS